MSYDTERRGGKKTNPRADIPTVIFSLRRPVLMLAATRAILLFGIPCKSAHTDASSSFLSFPKANTR